MIIGTGIDILEISRIEKVASAAFCKKLFTEKENEYLSSKGIESTAGYFCAKEAVSKALGTGFDGFQFKDIEILKDCGCPFVVLHGNASRIALNKGIDKVFLTISHSKTHATAMAVAEKVDAYGSRTEFSWSQRPIKIQDKYYPLNMLKTRNADCHKGDFGKVHVIGGCHEMSGAVALCAKAALRCGAGLVTCVIPESILDRVGSSVIEATYKSCAEIDGLLKLTKQEADEVIASTSVIAFGIGLGKNLMIKDTFTYMLTHSQKPMVIDADGLNLLSDMTEVLKEKRAMTVLTPHLGEMSRLTGMGIDMIKNDRLEVAMRFAKEHNVVLVLKGNHSIITDGNRWYENQTGNPGMATGGSGDVLTGIIAALIAQGHEPYEAAVLGVHIHGLAGDVAFSRYGNGLTAGDLIDPIGMLTTRL